MNEYIYNRYFNVVNYEVFLTKYKPVRNAWIVDLISFYLEMQHTICKVRLYLEKTRSEQTIEL